MNMFVLFAVLEQPEDQIAVLEKFAEIGVKGATILDSTGMGRVLAQGESKIELVSRLQEIVQGRGPSNKTLFSVIENRRLLRKAIDVVESICGDLEETGKGILFACPVEIVKGLAEG